MQNKRYTVVKIGSSKCNQDKYPSNEHYPELVRYVDDEEDLFVVELDLDGTLHENYNWWHASDFFFEENIIDFTTREWNS